MIQIYFNERVIKIVGKIMNNCPNVYQFTEIPSIQKFILDFDANQSITEIQIIHHNSEEVLEAIIQSAKYVVAAGGLVQNTDNQDFLFIHRLGKWDLPKGKMEKGETPSLCAVREVEEECGLSDLCLGSELPSTFHTYWIKGEFVVKRTYWFNMTSKQIETKPQTEEQITEAVWMKESDFPRVLSNTYPSITQLLRAITHQ